MDVNEFLSTLSEKGRAIVEEYLHAFKKKTTFTVEFSDTSHVEHTDPDKYLIFVSSKNNKNIECVFLHEFFHCVQHEEDFPSIRPYQPEQQAFADEFDSYFLDYNIRHRLEYHSYYEHREEINRLYNSIFNYFCLLRQNKHLTKTRKEQDSIDYGMSITLLSFSDINNKKLTKLLSLVKIVDIKAYEICQILYKHISENDYNTKEGMYKIFELAIQDLHLENQIFVQ